MRTSSPSGGKLGDELLGVEIFTTVPDARYMTQEYRADYNHVRPHSSLGYQTPAEFAATWAASGSASLRLRPPRSLASPTP